MPLRQARRGLLSVEGPSSRLRPKRLEDAYLKVCAALPYRTGQRAYRYSYRDREEVVPKGKDYVRLAQELRHY